MSDAFEDPRAYLQGRIARFTGTSCALFAALLALDYATPGEGEALLSSTRIAALVVLATHGAVWAYTRRGERPTAALRAAELTAMGAAMAVYATLPLFPPLEGGGGVMAMFVPIPMAVLVLMRAAVIPSPPWLSVAVALSWGGLMTASSTLGWEGVDVMIEQRLLEREQGGTPVDPRTLPFALSLLTTLAFAAVAGVISHVVFGLQRRAREAMQLGQYRLEAKIGEGGMGIVYRARHRMLRRPTAVKLLPPDKAGERAVARFEREVRQTSRLTHPNTVAIYDFGRTADGVFYYAMEYLDGLSLQGLVDTFGPVPPARAIHVLAQAADALTEAHGMGLVHRDIKPDNVMLCERGGVPDVVKVLDFGLVKQVDTPDDAALSAAHTVQGTPLYLAPEALTDPEGVDARSDVYALGALAYCLLAGRPPFLGHVVEVLGHHLHTAPAPLADHGVRVDPALEGVVRRCLEKTPDARFPTAAAVADALRACPDASGWPRARARDWWAAHRATIHGRHVAAPTPSLLTVARADGASDAASRPAPP